MHENKKPGSGPHRLKTRPLSARGQTVFLLRHGAIQSDGDAKRFIGQIDLPLADRGRQQARYWKTWLAEETLAGICCSDLGRCTETARIIAPNSLSIEATQELREIHLGQWEGLTFAHVRQHWPAAFRQRGKNLVGFRPSGGESFADLQKRVIPACEKAVRQTDGNLLIVAHSGVNRVILCQLLGMPLGHLFRISQSPGAMNIIERRPDGYRIHLMNLSPQV